MFKAKREEAYKILAPRFSVKNPLDDLEWRKGPKDVRSNLTSRDMKDLQATLYGISRGDPNRAAKAYTRFLEQPENGQVKERVLHLMSDNDIQMEQMVMNGIRSSIAHHTISRGSRTTAAETFVKNVCCAAVFDAAKIDKEKDPISRPQIMQILGTTREQVNGAFESAKRLIKENVVTESLTRQTRCDFVRDRLLQYVATYVAPHFQASDPVGLIRVKGSSPMYDNDV